MSDDPYKVLQVDPEAEPDVIQAAYRRLAQKYHPDTAGPAGGSRMASINRAWEILRDPAQRAAHDRGRAGLARDSGWSAPPSPTDPRRAPPGRGSGRANPAPRAGGHRSSTPSDPETVSRDWTSGRSTIGGGYDPSTMGASEGPGGAGPPPGSPAGSVLTFGRYGGWSLGEIARRDLDYVEWLDRTPVGRPYRDEIDAILRRTGRRTTTQSNATELRGLFRRR